MAKSGKPGDELRNAGDAIRDVAEEADQLAHTAASELEETAREAAPGAALLGAAAFLGLGGFSSLVVALGFALSRQRSTAPLFLGVGLLSAGAACAWMGGKSLPEDFFSRTRSELSRDLTRASRALH